MRAEPLFAVRVSKQDGFVVLALSALLDDDHMTTLAAPLSFRRAREVATELLHFADVIAAG